MASEPLEIRLEPARIDPARVVLAAGCALWIAVLIPALFESLWLDEAASWWLVAGGGGEILDRWRQWPYQSLPHSVIVWLAAALPGPRELAPRIPSVVAAVACLVVFHRLALRLVGRFGAVVALLVVLGRNDFFYAASMSRPYAFGLLALLVSWLALVRSHETGSARQLVLWAVSSALVPWFQVLLTLGLVAQLPYLIRALRRSDHPRRFAFAIASAVAAGLVAPLAGSIATLIQLGAGLSSVSPPTFAALCAAVVPPTTSVALLAGLGFGYAIEGRLRLDFSARLPDAAWVALPLWIFPVLGAALASWLASTQLFVSHYLVAGGFGLALAAGALADRVVDGRARLAIAVCFLLLVPLTAPFSGWPRDGTDWKRALSVADRVAQETGSPLLVPSWFVESRERREAAELAPGGRLLAPLSFYPVSSRVVGLPYLCNAVGREALDELWRQPWFASRPGGILLHHARSGYAQCLRNLHPDLVQRDVAAWGPLRMTILEFTPNAPAGSIADGGVRSGRTLLPPRAQRAFPQ
ncbi:MAG TPA: glycosyltransferase family 39 protein [Thermoanaerobaculia bacterium]|nr:glycosyltransferase family 39 protein [Thermoanaerobaculia bacterium]